MFARAFCLSLLTALLCPAYALVFAQSVTTPNAPWTRPTVFAARLVLTIHSGGVIAFSPDGERIAIYDGSMVEINDARDNRTQTTFAAPPKKNWIKLVWSDDGQRLAVLSRADKKDSGQVEVWDAKANGVVSTIAGLWRVDELTFSRDANKLLGLAEHKTAQAWDALSGRLLITLPAPEEGRWREMRWSPDGRRLLMTNYASEKALLWDAETGQLLPSQKLGKEVATMIDRLNNGDLFHSPDGATIVQVGYGRERVKLIDVASGRLRARLPVGGCTPDTYFGESGCEPPRFHPSGCFLLTQSYGKVRLWDARDGREIALLDGARYPANFSPDGRWLATGSKERGAILWKVVGK